MTRGILIAGDRSSLFSALCTEAAKRVEQYAVAFIPRDQTQEALQTRPATSLHSQETIRSNKAIHPSDALHVNEAGANRQLVLEWNPPSPVSAKTLVLSALNKMDHIDDAILVCVPPAYRKAPEDFSAAEIDSLIDCTIKGWFFLVRELTAAFRARKGGTLSLVLPELTAGFANKVGGDEKPDFIGPAAAAAFRSFAQGILLSSHNAPYNAMGFSLPEPGEENAFAAYVFKTMEDGRRNSGKWHKYGKFGFFR